MWDVGFGIWDLGFGEWEDSAWQDGTDETGFKGERRKAKAKGKVYYAYGASVLQVL